MLFLCFTVYDYQSLFHLVIIFLFFTLLFYFIFLPFLFSDALYYVLL